MEAVTSSNADVVDSLLECGGEVPDGAPDPGAELAHRPESLGDDGCLQLTP